MSFDSRLRDELRHAADEHFLREEVALQHVKATRPAEWADLTVVALQDRDSPRARHVRGQRVVGALAACALLAGAIALPVALRSRSRGAAAGSLAQYAGCGPAVATGYRSTAVVRVAPEPPTTPAPPSTAPTALPNLPLVEPGQFALGLCRRASAQSHLPADDSGIGFTASTNARGDLLSLTAVTPTRTGTTTLAHNWATLFEAERFAEARRQIREQQQNLRARVTQLHNELRDVDEQLVKLAPITYKDVLRFDGGPYSGPYAGSLNAPPPPVPEQGSTKLINLAFERVQILAQLSTSGANAGGMRIEEIRPDVYAQLVSQTPAVLIKPPHDSNTSTVLIAVGLLLGGAVLAGSAFLLGRRSRRVQPS